MDAKPFLERSGEQLSLVASVWSSVVMFFHLLFLEIRQKIAQTEARGLLFPPLVYSVVTAWKDMFQVFPSKCSGAHHWLSLPAEQEGESY